MMKRPLLVAWACWAGAGLTSAADRVDYNRDVRPILADHCFACHGPDEAARKSGLRLDLRDQATRPSKSGAMPIVAGKPEESELVERIFSDEPDRVMPQPKAGKPLTASQKETLRRWVAAGARYQGHWAFDPPHRPEVPPVKAAAWPRNPVDSFVLARLEAEGLQPSTEVDKVTLLRRATLDLTGLPPSPSEVSSFLDDRSPDAYEHAVDRLLASDRYGERMAMPWLDFARYADSNGYQSDSSRDMSPWRDWVIRAFNRNLPFDRFTVEQIAGDLLPEPTRDQLVATGFNRNHRLTSEGGSITEEWRVETVIDRVETTSLTWLGLTLGCARCHDHKYDPVTQKEFYQFFAFFNNVPESGMVGTESKNTEPTIAVPTPSMEAELARLEAVATEAGRHVAELEKELPRLVEAWEPEFRKQAEGTVAPWSTLEPSSVVSAGGATFTRLEDASWLAGGPNPPNDTYTITSPLKPGAFSGLLLEAFPDPSLPNGSLGRYPNGNFVLTGVEAEIVISGEEAPRKARFVSAEADYSQPNYEARFLVDDNPVNGWAISGNDPDKRQPRKLVLAADAPITVPGNATITVRLRHDAIDRHNIGRFRLSTTSRPREMVKLDDSKVAPSILTLINIEPEKRTPKQAAELTAYFRKEVDSPIRRADQALASAGKAAKTHRDSFPNSMVMRELPKPREAFLLIRGQYDRRGEPVTAGLPAALPPLPPCPPASR